MRVTVLHRYQVSLLLGLFLLFFAGHACAADLAAVIDTRARSVARGEFLEWTVKAFSMKVQSGQCTLPFDAVPARYKRALCTLQAKGVLSAVFPDASTDFTKPITRGDALILMTVLTNTFIPADISQFRDSDTKNERLLQAMRTAVAKKWMSPLTSSYFGVSRTLSGAHALTLLQAATDQNPVKQKVKIRFNVQSVPQTNLAVPNAALVNAVWQLIQRDYLHSEAIDSKEASYKMIEGLVQSTGDPYTTFFRPVQADQFQTQIKGEVTGIGAHVEVLSGALVIITPLPQSPAEKAGLRPGDIILKANEKSLSGLPLDQAVSYIRGAKGTSVTLFIQRGSSQFSVTVVRDVISIPEIKTTQQGSVMIVTLAQFGETTDGKIRAVMKNVADKRPRGIVLDLRNNPGGLLHAADMLLSTLLPRGSVVAQVKGKKDASQEITEFEPVIHVDTPVAVLVNKGSASAAEIVAGALQDYKRATIVGQKTFGKGTVQEVLTFEGGEALKVTIAEWLTPHGRTIEKVGVTPDVLTTETATPDQELKAAVNALR